MAETSIETFDMASFAKAVQERIAIGQKNFLPWLREHRERFTGFTPTGKFKIFYPGCGVMPGLAPLIAALVEFTPYREFEITALDVKDMFIKVIVPIYSSLEIWEQLRIDQLRLKNGGNAVGIELGLSDDKLVSKPSAVKVSINYIPSDMLLFINNNRNRFDCIFVEHPHTESIMLLGEFLSKYTGGACNYRQTIGQMFLAAKPNTLIIAACHTGPELIQTRRLLELSFPNGQFAQRIYPNIYPTDAAVYKNMICAKTGPIPAPGSVEEREKVIENSHMISNADYYFRQAFLIKLLFLFYTKESCLSIFNDPFARNNWIGFLVYLNFAVSSLLHYVDKKSFYVQAAAVGLQALFLYMQTSAPEATGTLDVAPTLG